MAATAASVEQIVLIEQMKMIFHATAGATLAATAFAIALCWHLQPLVATPMLLGWLAIKIAVAVPRVVHGVMFRRRRNDSLAWLYWGRRLLLLDGIAWGAAGIMLMPAHDVAGMTVVGASLGAVAAVAAFVLHSEWRSCEMFVVPLLLLPIVYFYSRLSAFGFYGGTCFLVFLVLLLGVARQSARHVAELLTLRYQSGRMAADIGGALRAAEEQGRIKDAFMANMSHELRTPLHGILGLTKMLLKSASAEHADALTLIRRSGDHLLGLINNILEHSRLTVQGIDLHPQEAEVAGIVSDAAAMCMPAAMEKHLSLTCDTLLEAPLVAMLDPFRLRQILLNLIGNAVKFTDRGSVRVFACERESGTQLELVVEDTGVGMSKEVMEHLFEPFSQGDASSRRRFGGTGLGLNITRAICDAMGGTIACTSEPGRGTKFTVRLPLSKVDQPVERFTGADAAVSHYATTHLDDLQGVVLLAEDNDVNALVAEFTLRKYGLDVERARTGVEVVRSMCSTGRRPDLVLLDCQMPEMDGFEAARRVRAFEAQHGLQNVPIVALTANVFPEDRDRCRDAGMDAFLGKPFSDQQLRDMLQIYLVLPPETAATVAPDYAARLH